MPPREVRRERVRAEFVWRGGVDCLFWLVWLILVWLKWDWGGGSYHFD